MPVFIYFFPVFFITLWVLVCYLISKMGWNDLVTHYEITPPFEGSRIGIISASVNRGNYNNALILKYDSRGFYLRPTIPFRLFHKAVFIPWKDVTQVKERKVFIQSYKELVVGNPYVATIGITNKVYQQLLHQIPSVPGR